MTIFASRKVRFIPQQAAADCGLACIAMILSSYGRRTTLSELRLSFPVGREGTGSTKISLIASHFGISSRLYRTEGIDFAGLAFPLMLHWDLSHWVILESASSRGYTVVDPAIGRCRLSAEEFSNHFSGYLLTFKATERFQRKTREAYSPAWKMLRNQMSKASGGVLLPLVIISSILLQLLGLTIPFLIRLVTDKVVPSGSSELMMPIVAMGISVALTQGLVSLLRLLALIRLRVCMDLATLSETLFDILRLPFSFFQSHGSGDLITRVMGVTTMRTLLTGPALTGLIDCFVLLIYLFELWKMNAHLATIIYAFAAIQLCSIVASGNVQRRLARTSYAATADQTNFLIGVLSGIEYLKASGSESFAVTRWMSFLRKQLNASTRAGYVSSSLSMVGNICSTGGSLAILLVGVDNVLRGRMTLGTVLGATSLSSLIFGPLGNLSQFLDQFRNATAYVERLDDIIATPKELYGASSQQPTGSISKRWSGAVSLKHVGFSHIGASTPVLSDITLQISAGQTLALVGRTGSGKSTLLNLIVGLYENAHGVISYDDIAIDVTNKGEFRRCIGLVPQNPVLFNASLRENIALGLEESSLDEVIRACKLAYIHDEISSLPLGYDTIVAEQGANFSGGQRQRIALARALLRKPILLALDEATSHLDAITERSIQETLGREQCTQVIVAHRLSTIQRADQIAVLEDGMVCEVGSHEELMCRGGLYSTMIRDQLQQQNR